MAIIAVNQPTHRDPTLSLSMDLVPVILSNRRSFQLTLCIMCCTEKGIVVILLLSPCLRILTEEKETSGELWTNISCFYRCPERNTAFSDIFCSDIHAWKDLVSPLALVSSRFHRIRSICSIPLAYYLPSNATSVCHFALSLARY